MKQIDARRDALRGDFKRRRGTWSAWHEDLLALSPDFFESFLNMSSLPWTSGVLAPKVKEFIYIAIDAATTHLYQRGLHVHTANALKHGATRDELLEVLHIVSLLGAHTLAVGVPILVEELRKAGRSVPAEGAKLAPHLAELKAQFASKLGYWEDYWDILLAMAPQLFEVHCRYAALYSASSSLEPKVREFIAISVCAATTHLYEPGIRIHVQRAIELGASATELMEVLQLSSALGIHTCSIGVPILTEELNRAGFTIA